MSFAELLQAARSGSRGALGELLESFRDRLLAFGGRLARRCGMEPLDLVQETFLAATLHLADFHGAHQEEMFRWLRRILLNRVRDRSRRARACKRDSGRELPLHLFADQLAALADSDDGDFPAQLDPERIQAALAALSKGYRDLIVAHFWEGQTHAQIAARTGRSETAVRQACSRALKALRKILTEKS